MKEKIFITNFKKKIKAQDLKKKQQNCCGAELEEVQNHKICYICITHLHRHHHKKGTMGMYC